MTPDDIDLSDLFNDPPSADFSRWSKTKPPRYMTATNALIQQQNAEIEMAKLRVVFQRFSLDTIDYPNLWTRGDQQRAQDEGWAIGNVLRLPGSVSPGKAIEATPCIGKVGGTFVSDEDAHAWVASRAEQGTGAVGIYKRALAVVAALTIRMGGQ